MGLKRMQVRCSFALYFMEGEFVCVCVVVVIYASLLFQADFVIHFEFPIG